MEWKYYENPNKLMHRMAFSLTADIGCEEGGGATVNSIVAPSPRVNCTTNTPTAKAQNFIGAMLYNRWWFDHDKFGVTVGGGFMANPGRYLVLLPPINGANATSGTPYFTENPGQKFSAYDFQAAIQWMPTQFVTWSAEFTQRGANVPYFSSWVPAASLLRAATTVCRQATSATTEPHRRAAIVRLTADSGIRISGSRKGGSFSL